ncbi:MAG TPA: GspE/PulE family protein [Euzebya sp.]|nr:GspE/PulE family protein [Euzebya sp.]
MTDLRCAGEDVDETPVGDRVDPIVAGDAARALSEVEALGTTPRAGRPSEAFLRMVPHDYARRHLLLALDDGTLLRAATTPPLVVFNISARLGQSGAADEREQIAAVDELAARIDEAYARYVAAHEDDTQGSTGEAESDRPVMLVEDSGEDVELAVAAALREADEDLLATSGKPPSVRLVDLILFEAVRRGASDVHVQPTRDKTLVRYRLDGALHTVRELPGSLAAAVVGRIKVMARLDIAERRAPQDGRATVSMGASVRATAGAQLRTGLGPARIDLRISTLPSAYGERVVIRLLDPAHSAQLLTLSALGMPDDIRLRLESYAARPSGIILSTGPTGSGKTTTLYALLAWTTATNGGERTRQAASAGSELNVLTIEDPVEYDLSPLGVSQTQADPKKGLSFAAGLRHILRQDPDVIMVGEIRDEETARIAVQASLTGHLVLSTLHTSDAAGAIARLIDLSVEPFLVCSSLSSVLAQRLVRRVHAVCGGVGCEACLQSGFKGRTGVFELLEVTPRIRELIAARASAEHVGQAAIAQGMTSLRAAGERLAAARITTMAEVARAITVTDEEPQAREVVAT